MILGQYAQAIKTVLSLYDGFFFFDVPELCLTYTNVLSFLQMTLGFMSMIDFFLLSRKWGFDR